MQPHFDYACSVWHPNLSNRLLLFFIIIIIIFIIIIIIITDLFIVDNLR